MEVFFGDSLNCQTRHFSRSVTVRRQSGSKEFRGEALQLFFMDRHLGFGALYLLSGLLSELFEILSMAPL